MKRRAPYAVAVAQDAITEFRGEYEFLSNFYPHEIVIDGVTYPTAEHAFQALKTDDPIERDRIREAPSAYMAKRRGKEVNMRETWNTERFDVMEQVLRIKFQDPDLAAKLLATGNRSLIEGNNWRDTTWGCVKDKEGEWRGQNRLGLALMKVREELRGR